MPMETSRDILYFTGGALAYAGYHVHERMHPLHTHSFVEIAVAIGGTGTHHCLAGRQELSAGDVILLRPGVWHGYEQCRDLELYNCCFSNELLQRELAWTRDDPLLGYFLWTGPYSAQRRGTLATRLDPGTLDECMGHLHALERMRHVSVASHRGDIIGRLSLLLASLARTVTDPQRDVFGAAGLVHPAVGQAMRLLETSLARQWTLTDLAGQLHLAPGYLVRLFKSATGLPPMAYLARRRAEAAAALLLHTDEPITCIGRSVGWPDQNYFARRFKAHYGLTATSYRKSFAAVTARLDGKAGANPRPRRAAS
jgi:AraC-like DNA-binding protein/mannose-6-phosphate isomerase-like protein (cupin superfamily)